MFATSSFSDTVGNVKLQRHCWQRQASATLLATGCIDCVLDRSRASDPIIKTKVNLNVPIDTVGESDAGRRLSLARISSRLLPVRCTPAEQHSGTNHPLQWPPTANLSPPCLAPDRRWHQEQPLHRSFILAHICSFVYTLYT
jgi:hypothetical protein